MVQGSLRMAYVCAGRVCKSFLRVFCHCTFSRCINDLGSLLILDHDFRVVNGGQHPEDQKIQKRRLSKSLLRHDIPHR
jgi:hypothetical protein